MYVMSSPRFFAQSRFQIAPGMSGGAVYDAAGSLALSRSRLGSIPLAWLLPAEAICKALEVD